ncbi:MAG: choloylglycine hydrolase family protein [Lachnospiraceae bacterium]|nr:choloylglycine hydrolase family protein [Lachnospiraceae bacterium]
MCTAITVQSMDGENFLGRTLDFSYDVQPGLYVIPKNYKWCSSATMKKYVDCYSFLCIGQKKEDTFSLLDGVNERGFAAAALYFEGYADYDLRAKDKKAIGCLDFLHYILGRCGSIADLKELLKNICIISQQDPITQTVHPLHWIATDRSGRSVVIEQTKAGLKMINNAIGVMTNNPDFCWHMTNLRNYSNLSVEQQPKAYWNDVTVAPLSTGSGSTPLPGGFTSPDRFVRTSFIKTHIQPSKSQAETIMTVFQILSCVSIPKGVVITAKGTFDYTKYTALMDTKTCEYYFKTHENDHIAKVSLWDYYSSRKLPIFLGSLIRLPIFFEQF